MLSSGQQLNTNADELSRLSLMTSESEEVSPAALVNLMQIDALPVTRHQLRQYTERNQVLSKVINYTSVIYNYGLANY